MRPSLAEYPANPDRGLIVALALALVIHAALILGIRFDPLSDSHDEPVSSINVSLLRQAGSESAVSAAEPAPSPGEPSLSPTPPPRPEESPPLEELPPAEIVEPAGPVTAPTPPEKSVRAKPLEPAQPDRTSPTPSHTPEPEASAPEKIHRKPPEPKPTPPAPSAMEIMNQGLQMARLAPSAGSPAGKVREKYFNPQAKSTVEDYYVMNWVRKVEQVGTLNFPDEARRRNLSGSLILDVALRSDGSIRDITLVRSSGHKVLDDAARNIVQLAAPYAPFPEEMRRQYDILHIKRSWQFLQNNRVRGN